MLNILRILQNNKLTGTIPNLIGNLTNLGYLYVINKFIKIIWLLRYLNNNQLNGTIPNLIGNLTKLHVLYEVN